MRLILWRLMLAGHSVLSAVGPVKHARDMMIAARVSRPSMCGSRLDSSVHFAASGRTDSQGAKTMSAGRFE